VSERLGRRLREADDDQVEAEEKRPGLLEQQ